VYVLQGTVFSIPASMSTLEALSQMARDHKSSLGVVDPTSGELISNLSVSDLRYGPGWLPLMCACYGNLASQLAVNLPFVLNNDQGCLSAWG